jgi:hypothetical protein
VIYDGVSKSFRTESTTKYTLTFGITRREAKQRVMAAKLTRLTHKIATQLHLVAESSTICSCRSRRPVRTILDAPLYSTRGEMKKRRNIIRIFVVCTLRLIYTVKSEECNKRGFYHAWGK